MDFVKILDALVSAEPDVVELWQKLRPFVIINHAMTPEAKAGIVSLAEQFDPKAVARAAGNPVPEDDEAPRTARKKVK